MLVVAPVIVTLCQKEGRVPAAPPEPQVCPACDILLYYAWLRCCLFKRCAVKADQQKAGSTTPSQPHAREVPCQADPPVLSRLSAASQPQGWRIGPAHLPARARPAHH